MNNYCCWLCAAPVCNGSVLGAINACTCRYISDSASYPDVPFAAMDVDYNNKVDIIDALFLQYTIARKYRFLDDTDNSGPKLVQNGCDFSFSVRLLTDGGLAVVDGATTSVLVQVRACVGACAAA